MHKNFKIEIYKIKINMYNKMKIKEIIYLCAIKVKRKKIIIAYR